MKSSFVISIAVLMMVLVSCHNASEKDYASITDSTSVYGLRGDEVKLVKTASIDCKVKNVHLSSRTISELAHTVGGMISHQNITSQQDDRKEMKLNSDSLLVVSSYTTHADIVARIPVQHLETFLNGVSDLASYISTSNLDIDDQSMQFLSSKLKQQNRDNLLGDIQPKKVKDAVSVIDQKDIGVDQQIARKEIDASAKYSTVHLDLKQDPLIKKEVIANYSLADYNLPFGSNLLQSLSDGWKYFLSFIITIANLWVFIIIAIVSLFIWKQYKQKKTILTVESPGA